MHIKFWLKRKRLCYACFVSDQFVSLIWQRDSSTAENNAFLVFFLIEHSLHVPRLGNFPVFARIINYYVEYQARWDPHIATACLATITVKNHTELTLSANCRICSALMCVFLHLPEQFRCQVCCCTCGQAAGGSINNPRACSRRCCQENTYNEQKLPLTQKTNE